MQAAVIDAKDRLWALDNGRPVVNSDNLPAAPGGPKLIGFDLSNNTTEPFQTITFPESVLPATGYLNDVRFDLRSNVTTSGKGVAYIADSGGSRTIIAHLLTLQLTTGGFGIIVVDLGTGKSWRHLDRLYEVSARSRFLPTLQGIPTYSSTPLSPSFHFETAGGGGGCDGTSSKSSHREI